ncbi:hypothetical protein [Polynucleobacter sphagniphilus]|uniref:hypothetical protein n=1 Tax=Polynucleobacter sphagniphilus TaxID=1743169 RepID=UPI0024765E45|nr:hypothetical protein [Polynucleobacter sphagniphilus]MDH6300915.1 hypothetical protein [Polynucleobacter sphagniphilus]
MTEEMLTVGFDDSEDKLVFKFDMNYINTDDAVSLKVMTRLKAMIDAELGYLTSERVIVK